MDLEEVLNKIDAKLAEQRGAPATTSRPDTNRYVAPGADPDFVRRVAEGAEYATAPREGGPVTESRGAFGTTLKALAEGTGTAGGVLVPVEFATEVLKALRARSVVFRLGPRQIDVKKELDLLSLSTGAAAFWTAENARITPSEETFAQSVLLTPKVLAALVPVSNRLLRDATAADAEGVVRDDLAEVLSLAFDLAALRGTGGTAPTGIRSQAGVTVTSLGTNGATPTFDNLIDVIANVRAQNGPYLNPGWAFHPRTLQTLMKIKDGQGRYLADAGLLTFDTPGATGRLLGAAYFTTTQIPTNITQGTSSDTSEIYFGSDWQELWIGIEQAFTLDLSTEAAYNSDGTTWNSAFQQLQTLFRASWVLDVAPRRPQLFTVVTGVRP